MRAVTLVLLFTLLNGCAPQKFESQLAAREAAELRVSNESLSLEVRERDARIAAMQAELQRHSEAAKQTPVAPPASAIPIPISRPAMPDRPAAATANASPSTDPITTFVYTTKTGSKYHAAGCSYLRKSAIRITLAEARTRHLSPCSRCRPPAQ